MANILEELPKTDDLSQLFAGKFNSDALGVGSLKGLDIAGLSASLSGSFQGFLPGNFSLPALPSSLSKDGFMAAFSAPLNQVKSINAASIKNSITGSALPVSLDAPAFDVNKVIAGITGKILPVNVSTPTFDIDIPGLDLTGMTGPLNRLAQAGVMAPVHLLNMLLNILSALVNTVSDPQKIATLTTEALDEIYGNQASLLSGGIPLNAIQNVLATLTSPAPGGVAFLDQYKSILDEIQIIQDGDFARVQKILQEAHSLVLPRLRQIEQARQAILNLKSNDTTALTNALQQVLQLASSDQVFLKPYFDTIETRLGGILDGVADPVNQLKDMAQQIQDYLNQAAAAAETAAKNISDSIQSTLKQINDFLQAAQDKVKEIETQINAFLAKMDVTAIVNTIKDGCNKVALNVETFFTKVEEVKQKLDAAVANISVQVDTTLKKTFNDLALQIRALLDKITEVLNRPEVKDALEKARQGIDKFKNTIDQASLKAVFDLVVTKTNGLDSKIKSLDVASMGTPQKTALKVGAKIIEEVKIDQIVKPELIKAFEEIRRPLQELIELLRDKALLIEQTIYSFDPGTVATDLILKSEPYQLIITTLEQFKPSSLLQPLKQANDLLTGLVKQLDPQILIDQVQKVYGKLSELLDSLSPEPLIRLINEAADTAVYQLGIVRNQELPNILQTIQHTISIERLMEGSGIQDIANASFWKTLTDALGGGYLDTVNTAMDDVEVRLGQIAGSLPFTNAIARLQAAVSAAEAEVAVDGVLLHKRLDELSTLLVTFADRVNQLQIRRANMVQNFSGYAELKYLLNDLDLNPLIQLSPAVAGLTAMNPADLAASVLGVNTTLNNQLAALHQLNLGAIQAAVQVIFRKQVGDPVRTLMSDLRIKLQPFKDAITAFKGILDALVAIPAKVDQDVKTVLDALGTAITSIIDNVLSAIQTFRGTLADILNGIYTRVKTLITSFSPYWILNSFAESDFAAGNRGDPAAPPAGMLTFARRIQSGSDTTGSKIPALLQSKLSTGELQVLQAETGGTLSAGNRANVIKAMNSALTDAGLCSSDVIASLKQSLDLAISQLQTQLTPAPGSLPPNSAQVQQNTVAYIHLYQLTSLRNSLMGASIAFNSGVDKQNAMIRLNRVILEASYVDDLNMSIQSLQPFIVVQVSMLYPQETVQRLDDLYTKIVDQIKGLPDLLIRAPLDDAFKKIKDVLKANFDISGIFNVLDLKVEGLDKDLSEGLDRLSVAYNQLLTTFDQRLSA